MHPDVEVLRATIRVPTVAERDPDLTDPAPFDQLHALLAEHFPRGEDDQNELPDRLIEV